MLIVLLYFLLSIFTILSHASNEGNKTTKLRHILYTHSEAELSNELVKQMSNGTIPIAIEVYEKKFFWKPNSYTIPPHFIVCHNTTKNIISRFEELKINFNKTIFNSINELFWLCNSYKKKCTFLSCTERHLRPLSYIIYPQPQPYNYPYH